jgi:hypothetical protein
MPSSRMSVAIRRSLRTRRSKCSPETTNGDNVGPPASSTSTASDMASAPLVARQPVDHHRNVDIGVLGGFVSRPRSEEANEAQATLETQGEPPRVRLDGAAKVGRQSAPVHGPRKASTCPEVRSRSHRRLARGARRRRKSCRLRLPPPLGKIDLDRVERRGAYLLAIPIDADFEPMSFVESTHGERPCVGIDVPQPLDADLGVERPA